MLLPACLLACMFFTKLFAIVCSKLFACGCVLAWCAWVAGCLLLTSLQCSHCCLNRSHYLHCWRFFNMCADYFAICDWKLSDWWTCTLWECTIVASVWLCICRASCVLVAVSVKLDCTRVFDVWVFFIAKHVFAFWFLCAVGFNAWCRTVCMFSHVEVGQRNVLLHVIVLDTGSRALLWYVFLWICVRLFFHQSLMSGPHCQSVFTVRVSVVVFNCWAMLSV